jgi:hypothetical protein
MFNIDMRLIPPVKDIDNYNGQEVFKIPVIVKTIMTHKREGPVFPIVFDRLDFKTGEIKTSMGLTFQKTINIFDDLGQQPPFATTAMAYKYQDRIAFKIVGLYNPGAWEELHDIKDIMNNDEKSILEVFHHHHKQLNEWVGNFKDSYYNAPKFQ